MKILCVCNYFQPMHYGENEVSRSLVEDGHQVTILTGDRYFPFPNYDESVKELIGERVVGVGTKRIKKVKVIRKKVWCEFAARTVFFGVKETILREKPDQILVFGASTPAAIQTAWLAPKNVSCTFIDSHLLSELERENGFTKKLFYFLFRLLFSNLISNRADKIVAAQEGTVDVIRQYYGIKKPVTVVSHGTDTKLFQFNQLKRSELRKQLHIKKTHFVVIYTGKIIPAKGVHLLVSACNSLREKIPTLHLILVGSGPKEYLDECNAQISENFKDNAHFVGVKKQEELPSYYSSADLAVWPLQESLAMVDAMSCGLPLIVNDQIGVKERFSNKNTLFYRSGSVGSLAKKIFFLYHNSTERRKMGKRSSALVKEKLSWSKKALEYLSNYA